MTTVLILTAGTGCGHLSVARALADAFAEVCGPDRQITIAAPFGDHVNGSYGWMITRAPDLWGACYAASDSRLGAAVGRSLLWSRFGPRFSRLLTELRPNVIVSVHALCTQIASSCLRGMGSNIPLYCVVTDLFDVHRLWAASQVTSYFVATNGAADALMRVGVAEQRVLITGLPLRRAFWTSHMTQSTRGIDREPSGGARVQVLAMDGGMPGPQLARVIEALKEAGVPLNIVTAWGRKAPPTRTSVVEGAHLCTVSNLGRDDCMETAMQGADIIVTKAGSLSIAEAFAVGRPLLIHRAIPGQEASNPSFVERIGAGIDTPTRRDLIDAVHRLGRSPLLRDGMSGRARLYGRPDAALDAACQIAGMARIGGCSPAFRALPRLASEAPAPGYTAVTSSA